MVEREKQYTIDIIATMAKTTIKKLWVIIILLILLLFGTNLAWVIYESQFTDESWSYEARAGENGNAIANGEGEVFIYGMGESNPQEENQQDGR